MRISLILLTAFIITSFLSCSSDKKKADAIVMTNEEIQDSLQTSRLNEEDNGDSSAVVNQYETDGNRTPAASASVASPDNSGNSNVTSADVPADNSTAAVTNKNSSTPSTASSPSRTTQPRKVMRKATVQQLLARDARLAKNMPLNRFGNYMTRRWNMYKGYGEVSYQDKTVEIKITDEEIKIETPEGKFKRESDEVKLKTEAGKVKKETRS